MTWRIAIGLLLAPLVPLVLVLLFSSNDLMFPVLLIFAAGGYPIAIIVGWPTHLLLAHRGLSSLLAYLLAGCAIGSLVGVSFVWMSFPEWAGAMLLCVSYGGAATSVFWWIAVRGARTR